MKYEIELRRRIFKESKQFTESRSRNAFMTGAESVIADIKDTSMAKIITKNLEMMEVLLEINNRYRSLMTEKMQQKLRIVISNQPEFKEEP